MNWGVSFLVATVTNHHHFAVASMMPIDHLAFCSEKNPSGLACAEVCHFSEICGGTHFLVFPSFDRFPVFLGPRPHSSPSKSALLPLSGCCSIRTSFSDYGPDLHIQRLTGLSCTPLASLSLVLQVIPARFL